ncbi:MAG: hypothetical protein M1827_005356 [Pycnora praestabilis]|nr:MAG: hypothetical protein M1827_005356 [Pycnora praestabilis]
MTAFEDAVIAPLIPQFSLDGSDDFEDAREAPDLQEKNLIRPGFFIWLLTISAGISGLLFGYDTGVISSTLVSIGSDLSHRPLTTLDKSVITSCTSLFALIASPITGILADRLGRKKVILVADVLFILGALCQAVTTSVWGMVAGRSIVGLAVGGASLLVPLGRLVTVASLLITGGQVVAYILGYMFSKQSHGWRWMVGLGALPAALQCFTLFSLPETPRWLVKAERKDEARIVLRRVFGNGQDTHEMVETVLNGIEVEILEEEGYARKRKSHTAPSIVTWPWLEKFRDGWAELFGVGATIFSLIGFISPILTSLSIAVTNFLFTLVAFYLIDRIGRRRILLYSIPIMIIGLLLCSIGFNFFRTTTSQGEAKVHDNHDNTSPGENSLWPFIILGAMILYVCGYAVGIGNVPWQQSELFPLSVRSLGSGLATSTNWSANFFVGLTFLPMMEVLTPMGTFALYALVCVVGWVSVWKIYPETKGLSLEQVSGLLEDGWGVERSLGRIG